MIVAFLTAQGRAAWADCKNDNECKGDRICERGECVSPQTAPSAPAAPAPAAAPAAAVPPPATVQPQAGTRVLFTGRSDFVSVEPREQGGAQGECRIPCSLQLPPGWYTVRAGGDAEAIEVGTRTTTVKVTSGCTACYITGSVNLALSIPLFVGAGVLLDSRSTEGAGAGLAAAGGIVAASGLALLIVGIAVGGSKIEQDDFAKNDRPAISPKIALAPSGVALSF
ncbi:MAG: hypothetical protein KF819_09810 [Labilithrix sp.]|nr:hypothetical protein [Labilithrix sp.]